MIIQRKLGLKLQMPGEAQWKMSTDFKKHYGPGLEEVTSPYQERLAVKHAEHGHRDCWVCERQRYCLVFWSRSIESRVRQETFELNERHLADYRRELATALAECKHLSTTEKQELKGIITLRRQASRHARPRASQVASGA